MGNWRVLILIAVAVALACWAGIILLDQQDKADAVAALNKPVHDSACFQSGYDQYGRPAWKTHGLYTTGTYASRSACEAANPRTTTRSHHHYSIGSRARDWLRFIGVAVVVLAVASIPLLAERRQRMRPTTS